MNIHSAAEQILPFACPSIQYRIRKEIFRESPEYPEMRALENQIIEEDSVQNIAASQGADGWLAERFHGYESMESRLRVLCEKGVEASQPVLSRALWGLEGHEDRLQSGLGSVGPILDDLGFGGGKAIRASLFALAGKEEKSLVQEQIQAALAAFKVAAGLSSLDEVCEPYKKGFVFRDGICWPSIYHLRLLAWTRNWRTAENGRIMVRSIQNLARLSPLPNIHTKYKSRIIAPASFCMHHFTPDLNRLSDAEWMQWFHRMELLSRLRVVDQIPELRSQVRALKRMLDKNQGRFLKQLNHPYFQKWGAYTGLALERDWRSAQRRINDLTFRSLLILNDSDR